MSAYSLRNTTQVLYHYTKVEPLLWVRALKEGVIKSLYVTGAPNNTFGYPYCITLEVHLKGIPNPEFLWGVKGNRCIKKWCKHQEKDWYLVDAKNVRVLDSFAYEQSGFSL